MNYIESIAEELFSEFLEYCGDSDQSKLIAAKSAIKHINLSKKNGYDIKFGDEIISFLEKKYILCIS